MTHNERVLALLADGEPHTHLEVYDLRVIAHSRVAALRKQGYRIACWQDDGVYWYRLLDEAHHNPPVRLVEQESGQFSLDVVAA